MENLQSSLTELLTALDAVKDVRDASTPVGYASIRAISEQIEAAAMLVRMDLAA